MESRVVARERFLEAAKRFQCIAAIVVRDHEIGFQAQCLIELVERKLRSAR